MEKEKVSFCSFYVNVTHLRYKIINYEVGIKV